MCQALASRFLAVEQLTLEAAKAYLKAPRKGKATNPYLRLYVEPEPPRKKQRATVEPDTPNLDSSMPGETYFQILFSSAI
jgi:hypothetical protein